MTLDILQFIDNKGGNAEEIKESQRKRGHPVELVDEVVQMYADWVKSLFSYFLSLKSRLICGQKVDYEINVMRKKVNEVQKEISAKKKVRIRDRLPISFYLNQDR